MPVWDLNPTENNKSWGFPKWLKNPELKLIFYKQDIKIITIEYVSL